MEGEGEGEGYEGELEADGVAPWAGSPRGVGGARGGPSLGNEEVDDHAVEDGRHAVGEEHHAPAPVGEKAADGHSHREAEVGRRAERGKAHRALGGRKEVPDDRGGGRAIEIGHEAEGHEQRDEDTDGRGQAHQAREAAAAEEAQHHRQAPAETVGHHSAHEDRDERAGPVAGQEEADLRGRKLEFPPEDDGEVRDDEAPDAVDNGARDEQADRGRQPPQQGGGADQHPRAARAQARGGLQLPAAGWPGRRRY